WYRKGSGMNDEISNRFDLDRLRLDTGEVWAVVPVKIQKRRGGFVQLPMTRDERLGGAKGQTYRVALFFVYQHSRNKGEPSRSPTACWRSTASHPEPNAGHCAIWYAVT